MPQINIAPTRTNLIRLKKELRFAKEGYEILDRKREALTGELVRVAKEADTLQKEVWALLETAYKAIEKARVVMGSDHVEWAALAVNKTVRGLNAPPRSPIQPLFLTKPQQHFAKCWSAFRSSRCSLPRYGALQMNLKRRKDA